MFPVDVKDALNRVTTFELDRQKEVFTIKVEYGLAGAMAGIFSAFIYSRQRLLSDDFWGEGESEQAALRDCLAKIHGLTPDQILARP